MSPKAERWLRKLRGFLLLVAIILVVGAVGLFTQVDRSAKLAVRSIHQASIPTPASTLRAGFGRARLTPVLGSPAENPTRGEFRTLPLAGYGDRHGEPAAGVHDDVFVKSVAFASGISTGVVISADALIIPRDIAETATAELARSHGLTRDQIYFSATHTHCSLGGWGQRFVGEAFAGPFNPGVRVWFAQRLAVAARMALDDLQPAALGPGAFDAPQFIRNRLVGDRGTVDPQFSLLYVRQARGTTAVLGSYSAHATVLGGSFRQFSADYPGMWQRGVEAGGVQLAMFLAGGVGSQGPRPPQPGWPGVEQMGSALASNTLALLPTIPLTNELAFSVSLAQVALPDLQVRVTDQVRLRPWAAKQLMPPLENATLLQAFRFGTNVWLSTPCDYSGELALELKTAARSVGQNAVVTSFNGDYIGYVIPAKYYHLDGYEPRLMNFYGPDVPRAFAAALEQLALGPRP